MRAVAIALLGLMLVPATTGIMNPGAPAAPSKSLQADLPNPLWADLRALQITPTRWASLLTSDADHNGMTDFLDTLLAVATASGRLETPVELLVYADHAARAHLLATNPSAVSIDPADAVFLTVTLERAPMLRLPGVALVVFEPRAYATASTNPAAGTPANLAQIQVHQGGAAWAAGYTGSGVKIAVLDTGADIGHQALDGGKVTAFKDCIGTATTSYDDHGHGTHVASIAAGDDGTDFRGIAYQASVVAVKVLDAAGSGTIANFGCGITYVRNYGGTPRADIATMSAGLAVPPLAITTLNGGETDVFAWDRTAEVLPTLADVPFTIAAGNWFGGGVEVLGADETTRVGVNGVNQVSSPGFATAVVTVGAIDSFQSAASFSALGPGKLGGTKPDVAAQGVLTWGALRGTTSSYEQWDGTSMATPLAAGVMALLIQKNGILGHVSYEAALRGGAAQGCVAYVSGACRASELPDPNFVMGYGVVKATPSLALV